MYAERIRKLLLSKSNAPTSKRSTRDRSPGPEAERDPDAPTVQSSQQRKVSTSTRYGLLTTSLFSFLLRGKRFCCIMVMFAFQGSHVARVVAANRS